MVSIMLMCNDFCELFSIACRGKKHCVCNCAALWHTVKKMRKWTNCEQERRLKLEFPFQLFYACATTMVVADDLDSHGKKRTVHFFDSGLT